ncbi:hypothetical protein QCA50_000654 [Cerrena zonata]|uniref:Cytochrome b5 heme-binding domain-containing protein n=1 Tax=Cerrena zonata TaxID=2478898 RepID=A0AAW0GVC4_9APHY
MATKIVTYEELKAHNTRDNVWLLIHEKVYNVAKFIDEHPGGDEVILAETVMQVRMPPEAFEDVGHSDEARALLPDMLVGDFEKDGALKVKSSTKSTSSHSTAVNSAVEQGSNMMYFVPLGLLGAYFAWRYYSGSA